MKTTGTSALERLLSIASDPVSTDRPEPVSLLDRYPLGSELIRILERKNGFYAFESALHVFPLTVRKTPGFTLQEWNSDSLWRNEYADLALDLLFFAEDIFQDQFCISSEGIFRFVAETGQRCFLADSFEGWARVILRNDRTETRWPLAHIWQERNGRLTEGTRLLPKTPFFLGGDYTLENLWAGDAVEGMRFKADLAMQTRNLPDGAKVRLVVGEKPKST